MRQLPIHRSSARPRLPPRDRPVSSLLPPGRQRFSGHCPANSPLVARNWWWSLALPDLRMLARRCATILVAPTPPPPPTESPVNETVWVQRPADLSLVSVFSAAAVVLVRMVPSSPSLCYYRVCPVEEDFRALVLLHRDRRFVQPMLHMSICKYTPGHSRGDIH